MGSDEKDSAFSKRDINMILFTAILFFGAVMAISVFCVAFFAPRTTQPKAIQAQEQKVDSVTCSTVKIIYPNIDRNETLLEKVGEGPQLRMLRQGLFGSVGDVFQFCEKVN